jgi:hypothetical protein
VVVTGLPKLLAAAEQAERNLAELAAHAALYASAREPGLAEAAVEQAYRQLWGSRPPSLSAQLSGERAPGPGAAAGWGRTVLACHAKLAYALREAGQLKNWVLVVEGPKGVGKTTYAFNSLAGALVDLGFPERYALEYTGEAFFWDLEEFAETVLELSETGGWVPFVVGDDWGMEAPKYWMMEGRREAMIKLAEALDTVKDVVGVLAITTPVFGKIASFLRELADMVGSFELVYVGGGRAVKALWHRPAEVLSGRRRSVRRAPLPAYLEALPPHARLPDEFWRLMLERRRAARAERLRAAAEKLKEGAEEEAEREEEGEEGV